MTDAPVKPAEAAPPKDAEKLAAKEARTKGQRSLFILVMLMFFVSIVVFVVGTYFFMVPHLITQDLEMRHMQLKLSTIEQALLTPDEATEEAATPEAAPAAPSAPKVKPAEPEKKAPKKPSPEGAK